MVSSNEYLSKIKTFSKDSHSEGVNFQRQSWLKSDSDIKVE